jgi:hypothetical protein
MRGGRGRDVGVTYRSVTSIWVSMTAAIMTPFRTTTVTRTVRM